MISTRGRGWRGTPRWMSSRGAGWSLTSVTTEIEWIKEWWRNSCGGEVKSTCTPLWEHVRRFFPYTLAARVQVEGQPHPSWWVELAWLGTSPTKSLDDVLQAISSIIDNIRTIVTVQIIPLMMTLLKDPSAAFSAACLVVNVTNAHFCLGTTWMLLISPNW